MPTIEQLLSRAGLARDLTPAAGGLWEFEVLHAVTIDAPRATVWAWLVELGQDRAGFSSYDWLERVFGADIRNVNEIRREWQTRRAGDRS